MREINKKLRHVDILSDIAVEKTKRRRSAAVELALASLSDAEVDTLEAHGYREPGVLARLWELEERYRACTSAPEAELVFRAARPEVEKLGRVLDLCNRIGWAIGR
jgi:hypothetical protein